MKRVFLIILDSCGCGWEPDAALFGDVGAHTLRSCSKSPEFSMPNMISMGLGNITGLRFLGSTQTPCAAYGRLRERSMGKDTTVGHWELAGIISPRALPTYPEGFPAEIIAEFSRQTGRGVLCNQPYSGTEVIRDYGRQHIETGDLIVYTSADSVFQIAAHEDVVPPEQLYAYCRIARKILTGEHGAGRVIARPFTGEWPYTRTANRHDFSLEPPAETMLDALKNAGKDVIGVGKIHDIFAGRGLTETIYTHGNTHGLEVTMELAERDFEGLCFVNLVDFDSMYGHRQDPDGYARALREFDGWLPDFLAKLGPDDLVMVTADHGCDPGDDSTDHTREYVPLLVLGQRVTPADLGTRTPFCAVAKTVTDLLGVQFSCPGRSFRKQLGL